MKNPPQLMICRQKTRYFIDKRTGTFNFRITKIKCTTRLFLDIRIVIAKISEIFFLKTLVYSVHLHSVRTCLEFL